MAILIIGESLANMSQSTFSIFLFMPATRAITFMSALQTGLISPLLLLLPVKYSTIVEIRHSTNKNLSVKLQMRLSYLPQMTKLDQDLRLVLLILIILDLLI